jgi:hypothetical protein
MRDCFHISRAGGRQPACPQPVSGRLLEEPRLVEVTGDQLRSGFKGVRKTLFKRGGDVRMQLLATLPEQALIGGVTHQRVLKDVGGRRRNAAAEDELGSDQTIQRGHEIGLRQRNDCRKQLVVELAANAGADLCHLLRRGEPIEARHQRVVQRRRYRQRREWPIENITVASVSEQSGFKDSLREFFAGFARDDACEVRLDKLESLLQEAATKPNNAVALFAELLGIPIGSRHALAAMSPLQKKGLLFRAFLAQLEGVAARGPVLVVLEDVHWLDPTSRELFDQMVERLQRLPVLLVATFRPELSPR